MIITSCNYLTTTTTVFFFSYFSDCCGEEICGDYPHWEVRNATVNHFPDGVFQKCRVAARQEREKQREAMRALDGDADLNSSTSSSSSSSSSNQSSSPRRSPATVVPLEILWLPTASHEQPALRDSQRGRHASTHGVSPSNSSRVSIAADTVSSNRIGGDSSHRYVATPSSSPTRSRPSPSTGHRHFSPSMGHHSSPSMGHRPSSQPR